VIELGTHFIYEYDDGPIWIYSNHNFGWILFPRIDIPRIEKCFVQSRDDIQLIIFGMKSIISDKNLFFKSKFTIRYEGSRDRTTAVRRLIDSTSKPGSMYLLRLMRMFFAEECYVI